jgi:hypothetical protein
MYRRFKAVYKIQQDDFTEKLPLGRYETGESSIMIATLELYSFLSFHNPFSAINLQMHVMIESRTMILMNLFAALLPKSFCFRVLTLFLEKSFPDDTWIL